VQRHPRASVPEQAGLSLVRDADRDRLDARHRPQAGRHLLRAAALDETLRHAVLGEAVLSLPAQQAWERYWTDHVGRALRLDRGSSAFAEIESRRALTDGWLAAWAAWTTRA